MTVKLLDNLRKEIKAKIDIADENILKQINSILIPEKYENDVVAFSLKGEPITRIDFQNIIDESKQQVKEGKFITLEEFEKVIESW